MFFGFGVAVGDCDFGCLGGDDAILAGEHRGHCEFLGAHVAFGVCGDVGG